MVDSRGEGQAGGQVAMFGMAETVGLLDVVIGLAIQITAPDLQTREVFMQRPIEVELG